jgi:soluble lytic murein transglycosylase
MSAAAFGRSSAGAALCLAALALPALALGDAAAEDRAEEPVPPAVVGAHAGRFERVAGWVHARIAGRLRSVDDRTRGLVAHAVLAEAKHAGVDPLLVLALMDVESSFDPAAVSDAGAVGLMQLRESTLRGEAERSGLPSVDPLDPVTNVCAGVRYLRRLIDAFGDVDVALMAYNAGPNRILGHLRRGGIPDRFQAYPRSVNAELARLRVSAARHAAWSARWSGGHARLACHVEARRRARRGAAPPTLAAGWPRAREDRPWAPHDAVPDERSRARAHARVTGRRARSRDRRPGAPAGVRRA